MKIGIIEERKTPSDSRVALTPLQCMELRKSGVDIVVQPSSSRCFSDRAYQAHRVPLSQDLSDCDVLLGVKEVPIGDLLEDKTYFFFSHTIKEQSYNRKLLQAIIQKNIQLYDYEVITNENNQRVIAFGKFAGMVGAHNALWTFQQRNGDFGLKRMYQYDDYEAAKSAYQNMKIPNAKIVLTGTGRVAGGAEIVLKDMGISKVRPIDFVLQKYDYPVYTQLSSFYYAKRKDGTEFDQVTDFYNHPEKYESDFHHFLPHTDIMINGIYWDNEAPAFFTIEEMRSADFRIKTIADVTCDIAPVSSIPSTLRASTIMDPVFGYDPHTEQECPPFRENCVDMMAIDNLPNELPKDASQAFGEQFIEFVLPELKKSASTMLDRARVTKNGSLGPHFQYLSNYLAGN